MKVLIVGGAKSGKSDFAQEIALKLAQGGPHYYVATLRNSGTEADAATIRSHLDRREGMGFQTIEQSSHILDGLEDADVSGTFLLDSVTTLLTNELYPPENNYVQDDLAAARCCDELVTFAQQVQNCVIVSDDLFSDCTRWKAEDDGFRQHLGQIHCCLAQMCDVVMEMSCGNLIVHKGEWR